jgi:hypothetical protein
MRLGSAQRGWWKEILRSARAAGGCKISRHFAGHSGACRSSVDLSSVLVGIGLA